MPRSRAGTPRSPAGQHLPGGASRDRLLPPPSPPASPPCGPHPPTPTHTYLLLRLLLQLVVPKCRLHYISQHLIYDALFHHLCTFQCGPRAWCLQGGRVGGCWARPSVISRSCVRQFDMHLGPIRPQVPGDTGQGGGEMAAPHTIPLNCLPAAPVLCYPPTAAAHLSTSPPLFLQRRHPHQAVHQLHDLAAFAKAPATRVIAEGASGGERGLACCVSERGGPLAGCPASWPPCSLLWPKASPPHTQVPCAAPAGTCRKSAPDPAPSSPPSLPAAGESSSSTLSGVAPTACKKRDQDLPSSSSIISSSTRISDSVSSIVGSGSAVGDALPEQ